MEVFAAVCAELESETTWMATAVGVLLFARPDVVKRTVHKIIYQKSLAFSCGRILHCSKLLPFFLLRKPVALQNTEEHQPLLSLCTTAVLNQ